MKRKVRRNNSSKPGTRSLPIRKPPKGSVLDVASFIPVVAGGRGGGALQVMRRTDLLPRTEQALLAAGHINFGETLLDTFTPTYGSYHPLGQSFFQFHESRLDATGSEGWAMELVPHRYAEQSLEFRVRTRGQASYLRVLLGQTKDDRTDRCILTVGVSSIQVNLSTQFNLDLFSRGYQHFDLYFPGSNAWEYVINLALRYTPNANKRAVCVLHRIEAYSSIRGFADEAFVPE